MYICFIPIPKLKAKAAYAAKRAKGPRIGKLKLKKVKETNRHMAHIDALLAKRRMTGAELVKNL